MTEKEQVPVVLLRLKGGGEVIGQLVTETEDVVTLRMPLSVNKKNVPGLSFPFVTFSYFMLFAPDDEPIPFKQSEISIRTVPRDAVTRFYRMELQDRSIQRDMDKQFDRVVNKETKREQLTEQQKEELKHLGHRVQLEAFDVKGIKAN